MTRRKTERRTEIVEARDVRRHLAANDLREEVALQNDVNSLLERLERRALPWVAMDGAQAGVAPANLPDDDGSKSAA